MNSHATIYSVYCSKCNKEQKKKMSWTGYLKYITMDGKSKGRHEIDASYVQREPSTCPFGHEIDTKRTRLIDNTEIVSSPISENRVA